MFIKKYFYELMIDKNKMNEIDKYIAGFPKQTQDALQQVRAAIKNAAPDA